VDNLLQAIEKSKHAPLNQFLHALGIRHIGEKAARSLALKCGSIDGFLALTASQLETIADFGPVMRESVLSWIGATQNRDMLRRLQALGVSPQPLEVAMDRPFAGKTVVITGTLLKPRQEWKQRLERLGFNVAAAVSAKTGYLLAGREPGSKLQKARQLNIPVLDESDMESLLTAHEP